MPEAGQKNTISCCWRLIARRLVAYIVIFTMVLGWIFSGILSIPLPIRNFPSFPPKIKITWAAPIVVYITDTASSTWKVPSNWNSASNTIEVIGGGGGGYNSSGLEAGGGGGGAYSLSNDVSLTPGGSVTMQIGTGGAVDTSGSDTYICNSTSNCTSIAGTAVVSGAKGGTGAISATGVAGGAAGSGIGSTTNSGGAGGSGPGGDTSGGGGGAAGPYGAGANGGDGGASNNDSGGGGGGHGGGYPGAAGTATGVGADGGNNYLNTGGGPGGSDGTIGTAGGGGGAGDKNGTGGAGGAGQEWSASYGSGGGGGGGGDNGIGANGGNYGGGGAGGSTAGSGAQGIIVITYSLAPDVAAPTPDPINFATAPDDAGISSIDMTANTGTDASPPIEYYFDYQTCVSDNGTGGTDSGWQSGDTTYTDTILDTNKCYAYTATARDSLGYKGSTSTAAEAYTTAATPGVPTLENADYTTIEINNDANGNPSANPNTEFAARIAASDPSDSTWDYMWVDTDGSPSVAPVWMIDATLDAITLSGLTASTTYDLIVKARNGDGDITASSTVTQETTKIHTLWLTTSGNQISAIDIGSSSAYVGGLFIATATTQTDITVVTITEQGSVDASTGLNNIELHYDLDTSPPYDCVSEDYAGGATQFGSTDTDGFSAADGISTFSGSTVTASSTATACFYVVMDITSSANDGEDIEIQITNPGSDITASGVQINPASAVLLGGTTNIYDYAVPTPDPINFATAPDDAGISSIDMTANTGTDASPPIEYYFDYQTCVSDNGTGGTDSGWQSGDTTYTDTVLDTNKCYAYTATARDAAGNKGSTSTAAEAYTTAATPGVPTLENADYTTIEINNDANGNPSANPDTEFAARIAASDPSDSTWDYMWVDTDGTPSVAPVWMTDATLDAITLSGLTASTTYDLIVKARNGDGDITASSTAVQETTKIHTLWLTTSGNQISAIDIGSTSAYVGGLFIATATTQTDITVVTITEQGSVDASTGLNNIELHYDLDTSPPYDCASESYGDGATQYGSTDTDGFSAANGSSTFNGSLVASSTATACFYVVMDVSTAANNGESLEIQISDPSSDIMASGVQINPGTPVAIAGATNLVTQMYQQSAYRWFDNFNGTSVGLGLTATHSQAAILTGWGQEFRLRLLLHVASTSLEQSGQDFTLQFAQEGSGSCASPEFSYATVTAVTAIAFNDNAAVSDNTALTATSADPVHGTDVVVNQTYEEDNNFTNSLAPIGEDQDGKWDFALVDNSGTASTSYCFRAVTASGTLLDYYDIYPKVTTKINNAPVNDSLDLLAHNDDDELYASTTHTWRVVVSDADGYTNLESVTLQLDYDGVSQDIIWDQAGDSFSEASNYFYETASSTCAGNQCTLDFILGLDWDWDAVDDTATDARVVSGDDYFSTTTTVFDTDTFQVENDLIITMNYYDDTRNPNPDTFIASGTIDYQGVTTPDPPEDIVDILLDPSWSAANYYDTDLLANGTWSISGITTDSSLGNASYFVVGMYNEPSGAGKASTSNQAMDIDRVIINSLTVSNHSYLGGGRYWDPNSGSMTVTINATLEDDGGNISAGTSTLVSTSFGGNAAANISEYSAIFSGGNAVATLSAASYGSGSNNTTYDNLYVSAISESSNVYGTAINDNATQPELGWDDVALTGGALAWGTIQIDSIQVTPSGGVDTGGSGVPTNLYYMAYDQATLYTAEEANSGWVNTAWSPSSLNANTAYAFVVQLVDNVGNLSASSTPSPVYRYTLANTPGAPSVDNPQANSLDVNPPAVDGTSTVIYAEIGATCDGAGGLGYVQANGTIAGEEVWQDDATWGTKTVIGLSAGTQYSFCVKTQNGDYTETTFGSTASDTTLTSRTYTQSAFRFFSNIASTGPLAVMTVSQDQNASLSTSSQPFRLRLLVHVGGENLAQNGQSFTLQFAQKSGTCAASSYATVTAATAISFYDNGGVNDGDAASATTTDPGHGGHTIRYQTYEEANNAANTQSAINDNEDGLWDFSLVDNSAPADTAYCLRLLTASSTPFNTYDVYPEIITYTSSSEGSPATVIFSDDVIFKENIIFR